MAFAEDLLEQAGHLAHREPRRPRQASLRRAVSTAYYAVFHLLIREATNNWRRAEHRNTLGRAFAHGQMKSASQKKRRDLDVLRMTLAPGRERDVAGHLQLVADTFLALQQHRHIADYDNSKRWSRRETLELVEAAAAAFESWNQVRDEPVAQDYLVSLLVKER